MFLMKQLTCETNIIYSFSKDHAPAMTVDAGETVVIETYDCFENQIESNDTELGSINWNQINPATGPIYVNGAQKGDLLKVTIETIEIGHQGVLATGEGLGMLGDELSGMTHRVLPIEDGYAVFDDRLKIPLTPMIGVIGVAPEGEAVSCGTPNHHGGNLDTKLMKEGATVYFPIFTEGALFALGDFHAAMGDGEVGGSGVEVPGKATVTLDVVKGHSIDHPVIVNEDGIAFHVSEKTLDEAVQGATKRAAHFLASEANLSPAEAVMILSAAGEAEISQVVDPLLTARMIIPQFILDAYGIQPFQS